MKKTINYTLLLAWSLVLLTACSTVKTTDGTSVRKRSTRFLTKKMTEQSRGDYEWFAGRAKMKFQDMQQNQSVRTTVRVRKDSAIWASFSLLGIEGARVLITPDSIKMINRLDKSYFVGDFKYIERTFQVPLDFQSLQDMIIGNPLYFTEYGTSWASDVVNDYYRIFGVSTFEAAYFLNTSSFQLEKMTFEDKAQNRKIDMRLEEYKKLDDKSSFSYFRDIYINSKTTGNAQLQIDYSKIEFDVPKSLPFNIPAKYKKME